MLERHLMNAFNPKTGNLDLTAFEKSLRNSN